jgi:hypothetical protein
VNGGCGCEDLSASALEDAREQWEKEGQPFPATFCELDPCMVIPLCPAPMLYKCLQSARLKLFFLQSGKNKGISRSWECCWVCWNAGEPEGKTKGG